MRINQSNQKNLILIVLLIGAVGLLVGSFNYLQNREGESLDDLANDSLIHPSVSSTPIFLEGAKSSQGTVSEKLPDIIKNPENSGLTDKEWRTLDFARKLQRLLAEDEQSALKLLAETDLTDLEFWILHDTLILHFGDKGDFFASADSLEMLRGSQAHRLFIDAISTLLMDHASKENPRMLWEYVTEENNLEIARSAAFFAATSMMDGVEKNHEEIFEMIRSTEEPNTKRLLTNGAFEQWALSDQGGFIDFLNETPVEEEYTDAYEQGAFILKNEQPQDALELASKIADPELRAQSTMYAAWKLWEMDPKAFENWWNQYPDKAVLDKVRDFIDGEVLVHDYNRPNANQQQ